MGDLGPGPSEVGEGALEFGLGSENPRMGERVSRIPPSFAAATLRLGNGGAAKEPKMAGAAANGEPRLGAGPPKVPLSNSTTMALRVSLSFLIRPIKFHILTFSDASFPASKQYLFLSARISSKAAM